MEKIPPFYLSQKFIDSQIKLREDEIKRILERTRRSWSRAGNRINLFVAGDIIDFLSDRALYFRGKGYKILLQRDGEIFHLIFICLDEKGKYQYFEENLRKETLFSIMNFLDVFREKDYLNQKKISLKP